MQISKEQIVEMIRGRGDHEQAEAAQAELPDQVDTDSNKDLLDKFGIDPSELMDKLKGNIPGL